MEPEGLLSDADDFQWNPQIDGDLLDATWSAADVSSLHGAPATAPLNPALNEE